MFRLLHENRLMAAEVSRLDGACAAARAAAVSTKQQSEADLDRVNEELKVI